MNERICNRLSLSKTVLLELDSGEIIQGQTVDISPRGALFNADTRPHAELQGMAGTLFLISEAGHFSVGYPCRVVRVKAAAIALEINKKAAAAFGNYLAKELLKR
jgi:hypothetical protein